MILKFLPKYYCSNKITRNSSFSILSEENLQYFSSILSPSQIKTTDIEKYNKDWMGKFSGNSNLVLFPKNTQEIQQIIKYCNKYKLALVPQSGNTGLTGGSVPLYDEIILSMEKYNKIEQFDENTNVLTVEGGVILEEANQYLKKYSYEIPWDLGAKGSCFVGGNVATHAGGKYFVKYGPLRSYILGIEVVTGSGDILDLKSTIRKDNTGLDLKQFFINSEGTLGIITKINVLCNKIDKDKNLLLINCSSFQDVLKIYNISKSTLNRNLAAIEWMDSYAFRIVMDNLKHVKNPFSSECEFDQDYFVLVEINTNHQMEELETQLFENLMQVEGFKDCIKAQNQQQFTNLWEIRESVALSCSTKAKFQLKYDISLDISLMDDLTKDLRQKLMDYECDIVGYGHIGDSNLHINVVSTNISNKEQVVSIVEPYIFQYLQKVKGSISAEHGLGQMKSQYLGLQKSQISIDYMRKIKQVFDPNGILNPYKVLPTN